MPFIQYVVMIYLSDQVRLIELETEQVKCLCKTFKGKSQVMDSILILQKTMESSRPKLYSNASLSSQTLCCKHYISIYLDEYLTKLWPSTQKSWVIKEILPSP